MAKKTDHQPATKGDLTAAVTGLRTELKGDIAAVRSELAAVKTELKDDIKNLSGELLKTNLKMDRLETNIMTGLRSFKSELLAAFEQSVVKGQMYDQKAVTHGAILRDHEDKLFKHEDRITLLETKK